MKRIKYSDDEKLKIIDEARSSGNITATGKRYSLSDSTIHGWIKKINKSKPEKDLQTELKKLKQKLSDRDLEVSILKDLLKKTVLVLNSDDKSLMSTSPNNILKQRF